MTCVEWCFVGKSLRSRTSGLVSDRQGRLRPHHGCVGRCRWRVGGGSARAGGQWQIVLRTASRRGSLFAAGRYAFTWTVKQRSVSLQVVVATKSSWHEKTGFRRAKKRLSARGL